MKSILQLDRETQLDRQRRLLFCWCYTEAAKTFSRPNTATDMTAFRCSMKRYAFSFSVP